MDDFKLHEKANPDPAESLWLRWICRWCRNPNAYGDDSCQICGMTKPELLCVDVRILD